jgi:DNA-binding transcriptional LysR family regulator
VDRLDGIAAFALVVETGSFTAAAQRLKLSKSAVSAHVQRLEERLGVQLLHRTTRRVATTEAGQAYHQYCVRILADAGSNWMKSDKNKFKEYHCVSLKIRSGPRR